MWIVISIVCFLVGAVVGLLIWEKQGREEQKGWEEYKEDQKEYIAILKKEIDAYKDVIKNEKSVITALEGRCDGLLIVIKAYNPSWKLDLYHPTPEDKQFELRCLLDDAHRFLHGKMHITELHRMTDFKEWDDRVDELLGRKTNDVVR